jgi:MAF protein
MENKFILASSSIYRKKILKTLIPQFTCISPKIDETPLPNEEPMLLVKRLATEKANAVARNNSNAIIIASDQCACHNNKIIGKPKNIKMAEQQLMSFSGCSIEFLTSLCVLDTINNQTNTIVDSFIVHFRKLTLLEVQKYIKKDSPLNCAGSFKSESLGIALFSKLDGSDHNSLIGLPLIQLNNILLNMGINILTDELIA